MEEVGSEFDRELSLLVVAVLFVLELSGVVAEGDEAMSLKEPMMLNVQERMTLVSLASKTCEALENIRVFLDSGAGVNLAQWDAFAQEARPILARLDRDNPGMVALPHDGVGWAKQKGEVMKKLMALFVLVALVACVAPPATPQIVVLTSPPVEVTREVQVTRVIIQLLEVTPPAPPLLPTPSYMATLPVVLFDDITWTRDVAHPRICVNQGVAFKLVIKGPPGLVVTYHINHYDDNGKKDYRSIDFTNTIEADRTLVKTFQEAFPYQSKWKVQAVVTWPLPLITRSAFITVDCN